ncbi:MAG: hypothetical protein SGBAC_002895 [Bacillariaceae sp.]
MTAEYLPDLAGDSSMSTAFEEDMDTLMCDFDMPHGTSGNNFRHSPRSVVTPPFKPVTVTFQGERFQPNPIVAPALEPLHQLEPTPIFPSMDSSYRSVSSDATTTTKSQAELDQLCKEGLEKLRETMKRSSATRQQLLRQRQALRF